MRRGKRRDPGQRRRPTGTAQRGAIPRQPTGIIAQIARELERVAESSNVALIEAMRPFLDLDTIEQGTALRARKRLIEFRAGRVPDDEAQQIVQRTFELTDTFNRRDFARTIGIAIPEFRTKMAAEWRREHVAKIKNIPQESRQRIIGYLEEVGERGMRVETLRKLLEENEGMTHRRARLVARDQVLTLNAKLTEQRHRAAGIVEYTWWTMGPGTNVRENHARLHGERFRYDDPPMGGGTGPKDRGNPGDGIGCRCQAIPVIPEFEDDED